MPDASHMLHRSWTYGKVFVGGGGMWRTSIYRATALGAILADFVCADGLISWNLLGRRHRVRSGAHHWGRGVYRYLLRAARLERETAGACTTVTRRRCIRKRATEEPIPRGASLKRNHGPTREDISPRHAVLDGTTLCTRLSVSSSCALAISDLVVTLRLVCSISVGERLPA